MPRASRLESTPLRSHSGLASRTRPSSVIRRPPFGAAPPLAGGLVEVAASPPPQQSLGGAEAVALGCVEEVDSELARVADRLDSLLLVEASPFAAELPGSEGD